NSYKWAREADPNLKLAYNDYNITNEAKGTWQREAIKTKIQYLIDQGAPLDIIGDQAHMDVPLTPHSRVLEILDEMAKFGKPIEITEFDAGIADDKIHGEYVRDWLIAAFSHPKVESFVMWGFWEGAHWRGAEGAMFRKDWSKRPAQEAYEKLVLNDWMTNKALSTGADGTIETRGFLGEYDVTITASGKSKTVKLKLPKDGARVQITL
ncbi:MAG: endo-1,4-beta-xylanase, partial [Armatimonadetes bacterium]|nr:endo-1,4-beta-xylanase [Armatimonadota bacterium]